jgi:prepilin-type N-terminal cleavage/methylation domain-containing protein
MVMYKNIFSKFNSTPSKAFTLIETMVSLMMISVALLGIYAAIAKYTQQTKQVKENYIASLLGQEGIEIIRNLRDTNWITGGRAAFSTGLISSNCNVDGTGGWRVDYLATSTADLVSNTAPVPYLYTNDTNGFYNYTSGTVTPYKRQICVVEDGDILHVSVVIYWTSHSTTIKEDLYNWKW